MIVEAVRQCDIWLPVHGHPVNGKKALFPGQRYELPDELAEPLVASGHLRVFGGITQVSGASRPQGRRK